MLTGSVVTGYWMNDFRIERLVTKQERDKQESERIDKLNRTFLKGEIDDVNTKMRAKWKVHENYFKDEYDKFSNDQIEQWNAIQTKEDKQ